MTHEFTERKFLTFPLERQHKKCAEILSRLYEKLLKKEEIDKEFIAYRQLSTWMKEKPLDAIHLKKIADRYHDHLKKACQHKKEHHLLPCIRQGDRSTGAHPWPIDVYLDHIRSAHNIGSILRTAEAFGLGTVYFSPDTPFIAHKQVQDASMGAYHWIKCEQAISLENLIKPLIAIETSDEAIPLDTFIFPDCFTLAMGNEEYGCSDEVLQLADYLVEIPLRGRKNSLNVANAFAIVAGEVSRQRRLKDQHDEQQIQ